MTFWKIAWRNLGRHYRRNLTTGLAITFGFTGVVLLGGYMLRMDRYLATQGIYLSHVGHISIYKKGGVDHALTEPERYTLSAEDQNNIRRVASQLARPPEFIGRYLRGQGLITNGCQSYPFIVSAVDPETERAIRAHPEVVERTPELLRLRKGHGFWEPGADADLIVPTYRLAELLKKPLVANDPRENRAALEQLITDCKDPAQKSLIAEHSGVQLIGATFSQGIAALDARISGHFSTGLSLSEDSALLMPLALAQNFYATDRVTSMALFLGPGTVTPLVAGELRDRFAAQGLDYDVYTYFDPIVNPFYVGAMGFVYVMTLFFLVLVCGVVVLSVLNSLQISLLERRSEIGTLRAIGFRPTKVTSLLLREIALLCAVSLTAGGFLAGMIAQIVNSLNIRFSLPGADDLQFMLRPGYLFAILVGLAFLAFALFAALLACRRYLKTPVVALLEST